MDKPRARTSSRLAETDKLLHEFEIRNFPDQYREYYGVKRNNFFASVQGFPRLWQCHLRLDAIWMREFEDLGATAEPSALLPMLLYGNANAKIRIAIELAFSQCMAEARAILRDAVEFVAHAHAMLRDPGLQLTKLAVLGLFSMLLTCSTMEQTFFGDYRARLALDAGLVRMRADFDRFKEKLRESLVSRFDIRPPGGVFPPPKPSIVTP